MRKKKKLIYIAMPYTAETTPKGIEQNIENARRFVRENFPSDSEFFPVIPHNTGIGVEGLGGESYWYDATESLMLACSAVVLGPGWRSSRGARNEFEAAQRAKIPVVEAQLVGDRLVERLRAVTAPRDRKLGDMTLTAILDNQQLRERVLRRMIPVFHTQITERCPSAILPADTRDLAWPLLHAISSVQQLREVSTDTLDAKQLHTECLDYIASGNVDLYPEFQLVQESPGRSLTDDETKITDVSDTLDREIIGDTCPGCCSCEPCFGPKPCRRICDGSGVLPAHKLGSKR